MKDKIVNWSYDHPYMTIFLFVVFGGIISWSILSGIKSRLEQFRIEQTKTADFIMYTDNGKIFGMEHEVIVDTDTGYQYLVFNVHGDYVIAPRISEDGTFYKTVE